MKTIIDPSEINQYAPGLNIFGAALDSAIVSTQFLVEGKLGANRPLVPTKRTEVLNLSGDGRAYLSHLPVLPASETMPIQARIRGGTQFAYGMGAASDWQELEPEQVEIDTVTGEAIVLNYGAMQSSLYTQHPNAYQHRNYRPSKRPQVPTLQIEYWAGFDFTSEDAEVVRIKQMFGQILILTQTDAGKGIKRRRIDGEYEVEYQNPVLLLNLKDQRTTGNIQLDNLLTFFHQYRPRSYAA